MDDDRIVDGLIVELADKLDAGDRTMPIHEQCIVVYGKYGLEISRVFPLTPETDAQDFWENHIAKDWGRPGPGVKHFSKLMPAKDFYKNLPVFRKPHDFLFIKVGVRSLDLADLVDANTLVTSKMEYTHLTKQLLAGMDILQSRMLHHIRQRQGDEIRLVVRHEYAG